MMKYAARLPDVSWVIVQMLLLLAVLLCPPVGSVAWLGKFISVGWVFCVAGLAMAALASWQLRQGRSLTPLPSPRAISTLLTSGLYRYVRHPVYSGLILWALGMALLRTSALHFVFWVLLWAFLTAKAAHEERLLARKIEDYAAYAARTPRIIPLNCCRLWRV